MESLYYDILAGAERLSRVFGETIKYELDEKQIFDINHVQAILIYNIADRTISIGDLISYGLYNGSNASYNLKKLIQEGYLLQTKTPNDKRSSFLSLSDKGKDLYAKLATAIEKQKKALGNKLSDKKMQELHKNLISLETNMRSFLSANPRHG